mgnify:CR=1 FL=1
MENCVSLEVHLVSLGAILYQYFYAVETVREFSSCGKHDGGVVRTFFLEILPKLVFLDCFVLNIIFQLSYHPSHDINSAEGCRSC